MKISSKIIVELLASGRSDERIRVRAQKINGKRGFAIEIIRLINEEEYQYVGWVSSKTVNENKTPWVLDQKSMCNMAFNASIAEISNA